MTEAEAAELRAWGRQMLAVLKSDDYRRGVARLFGSDEAYLPAGVEGGR